MNSGYTVFGSKVKNKHNSIHIKKNENINYTDSKWIVLSRFSRKLSEIMLYFTKNNMQYLITNFGYEEYIKLGKELYNIKLNPTIYPEYEQMRCILKITIEMFYGYIIQYKKLEGFNTITITVNEQTKILNSIQLMRERIIQLNKQMNIFEDTEMTMPEIKVYPEMIVYIQRYGFPENGVFDTEKLQEIMNELSVS